MAKKPIEMKAEAKIEKKPVNEVKELLKKYSNPNNVDEAVIKQQIEDYGIDEFKRIYKDKISD